jgi:hypothetical protein
MTSSVRFRLNAAAAGVLMLLLAAGAIAASTRAPSSIIALLILGLTLGASLIVVVNRYAAELMSEIRGAAGALLAASATISDSEELTATAAYIAARAERLQRLLSRLDGERARSDVRAAATKPVIPFVPQRFHAGRATPDR